jgi:glycosyltransferase involved in cell wall biosynthesis
MICNVKKILMTVDAVGGIWTYAVQLGAALQKYNIEVFFACMGPPPDNLQKKQLLRYDNIKLYENNYRLEWMDNPWEDLKNASEWLLHLNQTTSPDVIHLNGFYHAVLPWNAPVVVVAHSCVFSWFDHVKSTLPPPVWNQYKKYVQDGLNTAQCIVTPSYAMKHDINKHYNHSTPVVVIYNGIHVHSHKIKLKEPFILTAGRLWDKAKNFRILCKCAPDLSWPLYAAGSIDETTEIPVNCHLLGALSTEELTEWMHRASIFIAPSLYEPFGYTALEAALCGCTLILSDIESQREIWQDAALFVSPDDSEALIKITNQCISTPSCCKNMSEKAMKRAEKFTIDQMVPNYIDIYNFLLGRFSLLHGLTNT